MQNGVQIGDIARHYNEEELGGQENLLCVLQTENFELIARRATVADPAGYFVLLRTENGLAYLRPFEFGGNYRVKVTGAVEEGDALILDNGMLSPIGDRPMSGIVLARAESDGDRGNDPKVRPIWGSPMGVVSNPASRPDPSEDFAGAEA